MAAQVAANIGAAALLSARPVQIWMADCRWFSAAGWTLGLVFAPMLAALCEAAADTVSSELGQVLDGRPRMITTLRIAPPGTDGAISPAAHSPAWWLQASLPPPERLRCAAVGLLLAVSWVGGIFGLFFDSLLGATWNGAAGSTTMPSIFSRR